MENDLITLKIMRNFNDRQTFNISAPNPKTLNICFSFCLAVVFAQSIEARCLFENDDVVATAPTGDAPTTSEWSNFCLIKCDLY